MVLLRGPLQRALRVALLYSLHFGVGRADDRVLIRLLYSIFRLGRHPVGLVKHQAASAHAHAQVRRHACSAQVRWQSLQDGPLLRAEGDVRGWIAALGGQPVLVAGQQTCLHLADTFLIVALHRVFLVQILQQGACGHLKIVDLRELLLVDEVGGGAVVLAAVTVDLRLRQVEQALVGRENVYLRPFTRLFHRGLHVVQRSSLGARQFRGGNPLGERLAGAIDDEARGDGEGRRPRLHVRLLQVLLLLPGRLLCRVHRLGHLIARSLELLTLAERLGLAVMAGQFRIGASLHGAALRIGRDDLLRVVDVELQVVKEGPLQVRLLQLSHRQIFLQLLQSLRVLKCRHILVVVGDDGLGAVLGSILRAI